MVIEQNPKGNTEPNPIRREIQVDVSIPQKIEIKMVNASTLGDYELWGFIMFLFCNFTLGFIVAYVSNSNAVLNKLYLAIICIFSAFLIFSIVMTVHKRKKMSIEKKAIKMKLTKGFEPASVD